MYNILLLVEMKLFQKQDNSENGLSMSLEYY